MKNSSGRPSLADYLFALPLYLLPQHLVTGCFYWLSRNTNQRLKSNLIRAFIKRYRVDMQQAAEPDPDSYRCFNDFFVRRLKDRARPLCTDSNCYICPADSTVSELGKIQQGQLLQAKGQYYSLLKLLGNDENLAKQFEQGHFITLYLSPRDYHRVHMPISAKLKEMRYIPGRLFSVNPATSRVVKGLFARNERVVNLFESEQDKLAMILVGAIIVAGTETRWHGLVTSSRRCWQRVWRYTDGPSMAAGEEMGRFNVGSTVILLSNNPTLTWREDLAPGKTLCMGEKLAHFQQQD